MPFEHFLAFGVQQLPFAKPLLDGVRVALADLGQLVVGPAGAEREAAQSFAFPHLLDG